ncbi:response regulator [Mucilaginibacter gilvus]|uniref:Response regulator transcription factor n=1 Tax=Mucilaginibacter gilvus TaxID=2305909 RepID=A0A444MLE4_9SPHI|nr:response regulator [Mucilaginibacter gilvus]RWY50104.1 response regulator transcription factor [Mucilaginibacter gilvus]
MSKKILIVDDDPDILEILSLILSDTGYETMALAHGQTIFDDIRDFEPNLVLMDVMLAGMDGRAICKNIKENQFTSALPVILISGTHDLSDSLRLQGAPDDFIAKPFELDYLLSKVAQQFS